MSSPAVERQRQAYTTMVIVTPLAFVLSETQNALWSEQVCVLLHDVLVHLLFSLIRIAFHFEVIFELIWLFVCFLQWNYSPDSNLYSLCSLVDNIPQEPISWLLSKVVDTQGIRRVEISITYTINPPCSANPRVKFCNDSFDVYVWESDVMVTADKIPNPVNDDSSYRKLVTISGPTGNQRTLRTIPLQLDRPFIVIGFRDHVGCEALYSVEVTYNVCPTTTLKGSLVKLFETEAPSRALESNPVEGMCIEDSSHVQGNLTVLCESNGQWNTSQFEGKCYCNEDMQNVGGACSGMLRYRFFDDDLTVITKHLLYEQVIFRRNKIGNRRFAMVNFDLINSWFR